MPNGRIITAVCRECGWRSPQFKDLRQKLVQKDTVDTSNPEDLAMLYRKDVREGKILSVKDLVEAVQGKAVSHKWDRQKKDQAKKVLKKQLKDLLPPKKKDPKGRSSTRMNNGIKKLQSALSDLNNADLSVLRSKEEQVARKAKISQCGMERKKIFLSRYKILR